MTENQNTNQELSFTSKQLTGSMKKLVEMQTNHSNSYKGLTDKELHCFILTKFVDFIHEEYKKNQRYQEYLKLKAEFEGTEVALVVKDQPEDSPWYPDDSGEWVKIKNGEKPPELNDQDVITYMVKWGGQFKQLRNKVDLLDFSIILAYKKVR